MTGAVSGGPGAMKGLSYCAVLALAVALSACNTMRGGAHRAAQPVGAAGEPAAGAPAPAESQPVSPPQDTSNPEESNNEMSQPPDAATLVPCLPIDNTIPKVKTKPKHVRKKAPPPAPPAPQVAETPPDGVVDAQVAQLPVSVMSILGKKVQSPKGEDLGRVVDVLADSGGRVRVAIIDFGGFLGVGNRRIAVDWPLLRFNPDRRDPSLLLSLSLEKLKSAPEYKDNPRPQTLMLPAPDTAPAAPASAAPSGTATAPSGPAAAASGSPAAASAASPPPTATPPASDPKK
ncbi:MAG TPA: PRC-barrel domain-containing protein [Steroidobacteraceae bacterium]|nr:PRC-barrel domain-containing protein [Steroidobacteraceae bacterium]